MATLLGNTGKCSNQTVSEATAFNTVVEGLLSDLEVATPKINGFFAATTREVVSGGARVYAVAQCAETVTQSVCQNCLKVAVINIQSCPPQAGGSSIDAGCFMRYSDTSFFADNQTTDITPYLKEGETSIMFPAMYILIYVISCFFPFHLC